MSPPSETLCSRTLHHTLLRVIEKRQIIDDEKDRQGSVKYLGVLAEETDARIYTGLSMTNPVHLLLWRKQEVIQPSQQRLSFPNLVSKTPLTGPTQSDILGKIVLGAEKKKGGKDMGINVDKRKTALLVMDLQKHMVDEQSPLAQHAGFAEMVKKTSLIKRVRMVMDAVRAAGMLVITVKVDFSGGNFPRYPTRGEFCKIIAGENEAGQVLRPGVWGYDTVEEVAPLEEEPVVLKRHMSAFAGSNLDEVLRAHGITDIALTGVATNYVITATNWSALNYGYSCIVIEDCCTTHNDEAQEAAINTLRAIADICTAEVFIQAIQ